MPGFIGFWELIALAAVVLLLFGPRRLPEIGRSLGKGLREFKESVTAPLEHAEWADEPAMIEAAEPLDMDMSTGAHSAAGAPITEGTESAAATAPNPPRRRVGSGGRKQRRGRR